MFPVCIDSHWILVALFNVDRNSDCLLGVLDSLGIKWPNVVSNLQGYLEEEWMRRQSVDGYPKSMHINIKYMECPRQVNGYDCGIHLLFNAVKLLERFVKLHII